MVKYDTLVLNRCYLPIHIISWKRAMSLLYKGHAKSLDYNFVPYEYDKWIEYSNETPGDYDLVGTTNYSIAAPDLIVLSHYDKLPKRDIKFSRENVFHRDKHVCQYCGDKFKRAQLTIDHVVPKCQGGKSVWDNIVAACKDCNARKADKAPHQVGLKLIGKPLEPAWFSPISKLVHKPNLRQSWKNFMSNV